MLHSMRKAGCRHISHLLRRTMFTEFKLAAVTGWRTPAVMLMIMAFAMQIAFATWWALIKNFAVEDVGFTGREVGFQESIR